MDSLMRFWTTLYTRVFDFLDTCYVLPGVSMLALIIGFIVLLVLIPFLFSRR